MSIFGKFQADENWRSALKNLLHTERKSVLKNSAIIKEHQRYSQDITEELKDIIYNHRQLKADFMEKPSTSTSDIDQVSDDSFQALERMCDKTASDPNSTLFKYLNSDNKQQILSAMKLRNSNEHNSDFSKNRDLFEKLPEDCTILEDVEAPSQMWENTVNVNYICQTSPTKAIGLLRPSTILEEGEDDSNNSFLSSQKSFQTAATKQPISEASSTVYDTPFENTFAKVDNTNNPPNQSAISLKESFARKETVEYSEQIDNIPKVMQWLEKESQSGDAKEQTICSESNDSIIEVSSEEEYENHPNSMISVATVKQEHSISQKNLKTSLCKELFNDDNKENYQDDDCNILNNSENSMHFNDTMEEVGYMLEKGLQFMAAETALMNTEKQFRSPPPPPPQPAIPKPSNRKLLTESSSMNVKSNFVTPVKAPVKNNSYTFDMKPFPKLTVFPKIPSKDAKQKVSNFSHIISPISTYIHKTSTAPLMANVRLRDAGIPENSNSPAFRELVRESHLYKFDPAAKAALSAKLPKSNPEQRRLPKKAYIASNVKYIIDERSTITIPGGQKIQKYLESATTSNVLRHHGKLKIPNDMLNDPATTTTTARTEEEASNTEQYNRRGTPAGNPTPRSNASLADLSVMSGDISLYTMVDAQKFKKNL